MGKDKFENEDLIQYSFPKDIWFHVDDLSSAHVYLRLEGLDDIDKVPVDLLSEMCQLTKANSIEGSKKKEVAIVYTFAENLLKESDMQVGAVSFKDFKAKRYVKAVHKDKEVLNPLKKSKREEFPDLQALYNDKMKDLIKAEQREKTFAKIKEKEQEAEAKKKIKEAKMAKEIKEKEMQEFFEKVEEEKVQNTDDNENLLDDFW
uniref:NFACT RNA-binding domain-containing protein n=1 Tax=Euplotes harpa TaxID=151035 RepID=A0A7S3JDV5_9SPIT